MAIAVMGFTAVFAQDSTKRVRREMPKLTAEQRAEKTTAMMEKRLSLTADQKTKLDAFRSEAKEKMKDRKPGEGRGRGKKDKAPVVSNPPSMG